MQRLKKFITASVLGMSILSMTVVVSPANAAAPTAGDLFKTKTDSAVYYLGADNKRYVFPNENTYKTWYINASGKADFKSVTIKVITDAEMSAITRGGTVRFRAGTGILKFSASDTTMYAVEPNGVLRPITEAAAATIYGSAWRDRLFIASPYSFNDYTVGAALAANTYPVGTVIANAANELFYWDGATYRKFASDSVLAANGLSAKYVVNTTATIVATGAAITGAEAALGRSTMAQAGGTVVTGPVSGTGSGLTVALASDTPAAATYIRQSATIAQGVAPFTKINFTASSDGDVVVSTVKLTRSGISSDVDLTNIYLYDGNTKIAEHTSFNNKVITFMNTAGLFTVAKGTTKTLTVKADIAGGTTTVSGIALGINAASDITAGTAVVTGSFPFTGNTMAVGTVTDLGYLNIATVTAANYPSTIDPGVTANEVFRMNVTANSQEMALEGLRFTLVGTISTTDVVNFMLKDTTGTQIGTTVASLNASKELFFDATANPYKIASGQTKTLVVYADVPTGSARTFRFTLRKSADVVVKDNGYGVYVAPLYNSGAFSLIDVGSGSVTTINSGTLTSSVATDTPVGNIAAGATTVTLAKYTLKANGEDVKINYLNIDTTASRDFKNGKLLWNGSQVGSTDTVVATSTNQQFTVNQVIPAGTTVTVSYQADTNDNILGTAMTGTVAASLAASASGDATGQASLSNVTITAVTGKTLTLSAGTLAGTKNLAFGSMATANPTGVKGATNVKIASFVVTAGTGEGSSITQMVVTDGGGHSAGNNIGDNFQNMKLMTGATQLGATQGTLAHAGSDVFTFNISPAYTLAAGQQMVVDVYADILTGATGYITLGQQAGLQFTSVTGTGLLTSSDNSQTGQTTALQTIYISANGNLTVTADTIDAAQVVMGSTENTIGIFNFNASTSSEAINISMIRIKASANGDSFSNIKFYDGTTLLGTASSFSAAAGYATLNLTNNWVINKVNKVLTVKADVNDAASAAATDCTFSIENNSSITSIGAGSGTGITETVTSGTGITASPVKTKLTISKSASSPSGSAAAMAGQTVAIFSFTNSANVAQQTATVTDLAITISTSGTWTQWGAQATKSITVRKNSATGTLLGTSVVQAAPVSVALAGWSAASPFTSGGATLTDFDVAAGATVDIYVIADTSNAPATTGKLTASITATSGITWTDGVTASITTVNSLPVIAGTLSY
jgi:hypothetical protein